MTAEAKTGSRKGSTVRAVLWLLAGIVGLWFGFFVLNISGGADGLGTGEKALRIVFAIVWFTFWIVVMAANALKLSASSRSKRGAPRAVGAADERPAGETADAAGFEARLRGLASLKKDGLISEEEYQRKRDELMREKW